MSHAVLPATQILNVTPLIAAGDLGALLQIIAVILFVVIGLINKLLTSQKGNPAAPKRRPNPRPMAPPPKAEGKPGRQDLAAEIEEFLRRAAQKRSGEPVAPASEPVAPVRTSQRKQTLVERTRDAVLESQSDQPAPHETVDEHVRKHLSNQEFSRRAEHIADDVVRADQQMQEHLTKVFSHQLGRLADTSAGQPAAAEAANQAAMAPAAAGVSVATLLTSGHNIRNAIIMNEILQRPVDRW